MTIVFATGLSDDDYARVFKAWAWLSAEEIGLRYANRAARILGTHDPKPFVRTRPDLPSESLTSPALLS